MRKELLGRAGHGTAVLQRDARQPIAGEQLDKGRRRIGGDQLAVAQPQHADYSDPAAAGRPAWESRPPCANSPAPRLRLCEPSRSLPTNRAGRLASAAAAGNSRNIRRIRQRVMVSWRPNCCWRYSTAFCNWGSPAGSTASLFCAASGAGFGFRPDVLLAAALADSVGLFVGQRDLESGVRADSPFVLVGGLFQTMDVLAAGTPVAGGCQFQRGPASLDLNDVLHRAFAPAPLPDDLGPLVVLQARRDDFTGAGRKMVDQHRHGQIAGEQRRTVGLKSLAGPRRRGRGW